MKSIKMMQKTMLDEFEVDGIWHFNSSPGVKFHGRLSYSNTNIELNIFGSFDVDDDYIGKLNSDTILGKTLTGDLVTLFNPVTTSSTIRGNGFDSQTFEFNLFIVGGHFSSIEDLVFSNVVFNCTYLESFLSQKTFQRDREASRGTTTSISFIDPEIQEWRISAINATLRTSYKFSNRLSSHKYASMEYTALLKLIPDKPQKYHWYMDELNKLFNLFSVFIGKELFFKELSLINYTSNNEETLKYTVFFKQKNFVEGSSINGIQSITLRQIKDSLEESINNWYTLYSELDSLYKLYFNTYYHGVYDEWKFLNYTRILEGYHRMKYVESTYCDHDEYEQIKHKLHSCIDEILTEEHLRSLKSNLKNALSYSYEYSFQKRLTEVIKTIDKQIFKEIFKNRADMDKFIYKVKETRNKMTHPQSEDNTIYRGNDLHLANIRLSALIKTLILVDIGLSPEYISTKLPNLVYNLRIAKINFNK
ncbi:hypothetical protein CN324_21560 [Bacillus anthracis]|uniref:ApeA N-terminal domain 1-containing protein n=1 Tax=Bacillus paramobilis TaxID=2817477 RepID=UPI000BF3F75A|nr:hypothetical protein CN372_16855 [Bacillus anthracis]PFF18142.1 hypothetical protein CN324_21560 [Bacillus anthracis]PGX27726.1 hypothetical protein COE33_16360 [Bacillus anthracis]